MERKLNQWTLNGLVALALSVAPCVVGQSMDAAKSPAQLESQLTLEDLETLLRSDSIKDEVAQGLRLSELSPAARTQLLAKVSVLKKEKEQKLQEVEKQSMKLKEKLREERKNIQQERLRTYGPMDEAAKKKLFSNLLDEANADALDNQGQQKIESDYLVTITTQVGETSQAVHKIATKNTHLWTNINDRRVAQN